ncbi:MAG: hypothetical protein M3Y79_03445 [Pseudomonadota bacterium]|nr:hypothetical protein [Pseudomonadota bacterium]
MDAAGVAGAAQQLTQSLARLMEMAADYGRGMLESAEAQIAAEKRYRIRQACCIGALVILVPLALMFIGVAVLIAFWDTHRVAAAFAVAGGYVLLAAVAALVLGMRRPPRANGLVGLAAAAVITELLRRRR